MQNETSLMINDFNHLVLEWEFLLKLFKMILVSKYSEHSIIYDNINIVRSLYMNLWNTYRFNEGIFESA